MNKTATIADICSKLQIGYLTTMYRMSYEEVEKLNQKLNDLISRLSKPQALELSSDGLTICYECGRKININDCRKASD